MNVCTLNFAVSMPSFIYHHFCCTIYPPERGSGLSHFPREKVQWELQCSMQASANSQQERGLMGFVWIWLEFSTKLNTKINTGLEMVDIQVSRSKNLQSTCSSSWLGVDWCPLQLRETWEVPRWWQHASRHHQKMFGPKGLPPFVAQLEAEKTINWVIQITQQHSHHGAYLFTSTT